MPPKHLLSLATAAGRHGRTAFARTVVTPATAPLCRRAFATTIRAREQAGEKYAEKAEDVSAKYASKTKGMTRFWKTVSMERVGDTFQITLDGRRMKTPDGHPIAVPAKRRTLALLIAGEWEGQERLLKSYSLPLTSIVVRALDSFSDKAIREGVIENLLKYADTDATCYFQDYPDSFVALQSTHWKPLHTWLEHTYNLHLNTTTSILSIKQSPETIRTLRNIISEFDDIELAAFEKAVLFSKSFVVALALVKGRVDVDEAARAARLELLHQIDRWGEVEDAHDVDREECTRQLGAVACVGLP
ncbi:ATP12-domain-containing protein [Fimicolochytrium jonesii]|uniref:ATP12-domain-containing protein n=1 Tax=Fimicolochytrium jonesii TaxID=1396493 RepID=UPI0022FE497B|nr:ATP12-domain-containing protein [Fimicolochytrium jonesii]KAI8816460.1 ATP12-domain-containing protein [Fimicolochytrium jonesii]